MVRSGCLLALLLSLLWGQPVHVRASETPQPEVEIGDLRHQRLLEPVEFYIDAGRSGLDQVRDEVFSPLTGADINQGISDKSYWLRFRLRNDSNNDKTWVLHHETSYLDNLVVYHRDPGGDFRRSALSDREPFHTRPLDFRKLAFRHTTPAQGHTDIYLKLYFDKPDAVSLGLHLWDETAFNESSRRDYMVLGGYYGVLLILIAVALVFAFGQRQASALVYAGFLVCTAFMWLLFNGLGFQYLWPESVYLHNEGFHIGFLLFVLLGLHFSRLFLRTRHFFPATDKLITGLQVLAVVAIGLRFSGFYEPVLHFSYALLAVLAILLPVTGWRAWRQGINSARWYTLAWVVYSLSLLLNLISAYTTLLPWGMQPLAYLQIGSLVEVLLLMVAMAGRMLNLERDRREAVVMANRDTLTGLGNRRLLQLKYESFKATFSRDSLPVFLIMIDLDYFKRINDNYGHEAGDTVLREMGQLLLSCCRDSDVCIRYGGEEFAILMEAEDMDAVWQVAERIRTRFADTPTRYGDHTIGHTLSSGVTPVLSLNEMLSVREMMVRADAALYQSKAAGRNRTVVYSGEDDAADSAMEVSAG